MFGIAAGNVSEFMDPSSFKLGGSASTSLSHEDSVHGLVTEHAEAFTSVYEAVLERQCSFFPCVFDQNEILVRST